MDLKSVADENQRLSQFSTQEPLDTQWFTFSELSDPNALAPPRGCLLGGLGGCGRRDGLLENSIGGVQVGGWGWQEQFVALISAKTGDMWIFSWKIALKIESTIEHTYEHTIKRDKT